jgi:hypothetical protein
MAGPRTWSARPAAMALSMSASVTSRCSCAQPSTAVVIGRTSVRSARTGPLQSACASRNRASAPAGSRGAPARALASNDRACVRSRPSSPSRSR